MSSYLDQLLNIINTKNPPPPEKVSIKYLRMKKKSEKLTNQDLQNNIYPVGQGCVDIYPAGFPCK